MKSHVSNGFILCDGHIMNFLILASAILSIYFAFCHIKSSRGHHLIWKQKKRCYGSCSAAFKKRFNNHRSFRHQRLEKSTELSKRVWEHKNIGHDYQIQWSVIKEAASYRYGAKICSLCLVEKLLIIKAKPEVLLNKRSELISKCRHKNKFLLKMLIKPYALTKTSILRINHKPKRSAILSFRISRFNAFNSYLSNLI